MSSSSSCPTPKRDQIEIQFGRENEVLRSRTLPKSICTLRGIFDPIYTMKKPFFCMKLSRAHMYVDVLKKIAINKLLE
jgi:hypothetical protein